jgi:hypothetical protein
VERPRVAELAPASCSSPLSPPPQPPLALVCVCVRVRESLAICRVVTHDRRFALTQRWNPLSPLSTHNLESRGMPLSSARRGTVPGIRMRTHASPVPSVEPSVVFVEANTDNSASSVVASLCIEGRHAACIYSVSATWSV